MQVVFIFCPCTGVEITERRAGDHWYLWVVEKLRSQNHLVPAVGWVHISQIGVSQSASFL